MNNGIALFVTEWGTVNANGDGAVAEAETKQWTDFMCAYKLSHCNWSLNDKVEGASILTPGASTSGNWTANDLTTSGLLVRDLITDWCGETVVITQEPFEGSPYLIPGTIEAEHYDLGGLNVAFGENTTTNQAGATYRNDPVDIGGEPGNYNVGYIEAGEWLEYTVDVQESGQYTLDMRFAAADEFGGGSFTLRLDNEVVLESTTTGTTGGWSLWSDRTVQGLSLLEGEHVLRVGFTAGAFNVDKFTFTSDFVLSTPTAAESSEVAVYPNPGSGYYK